MAPPMAASELGLPPPRLQELVAEIRWPPHTAIGFVEAVGGVRSPIAADGDAVALCRAIHPDLALVVAHAGLGTINDSRLASAALREVAPAVVVHLNHFDPGDDLHQRNHQWLADIDHLDVTTSIDALAERVRAAGPR